MVVVTVAAFAGSQRFLFSSAGSSSAAERAATARGAKAPGAAAVMPRQRCQGSEAARQFVSALSRWRWIPPASGDWGPSPSSQGSEEDTPTATDQED